MVNYFINISFFLSKVDVVDDFISSCSDEVMIEQLVQYSMVVWR